jgi:hypothetical protein
MPRKHKKSPANQAGHVAGSPARLPRKSRRLGLVESTGYRSERRHREGGRAVGNGRLVHGDSRYGVQRYFVVGHRIAHAGMTRPAGRCSVEREGGPSYDEADECDDGALGVVHGDLLLLAMRYCIAMVVCSSCSRPPVCEYAHPETALDRARRKPVAATAGEWKRLQARSPTPPVRIGGNEREPTGCRFQPAPCIGLPRCWELGASSEAMAPLGCTSGATAMRPCSARQTRMRSCRRRVGVEELHAEAHLKETQENKTWPRQAKPCIAAAPHLSCR